MNINKQQIEQWLKDNRVDSKSVMQMLTYDDYTKSLAEMFCNMINDLSPKPECGEWWLCYTTHEVCLWTDGDEWYDSPDEKRREAFVDVRPIRRVA